MERPFRFEVLASDPAGAARRGRLTTARGIVETPAFMPVATVGSVKGVTPDVLRSIGAEILLANAYHLYLRPGVETVHELGGLSRFMGWDGPVLTDSGGFQMFSLSSLVKLGDDAVQIRSHIDGSLHELTPERVVGIEETLGVDILMPLDDCPPHPSERQRLIEAVERSARWLERSRLAWKGPGALFGIVQGGTDEGLRRESTARTIALDLPGHAVGGLAVGEPKPLFYDIAASTAAGLPLAKPRYLMGTGTPEDLLRLIGMGYDMFDCVLPTRNGRNGTLFTSRGRLNIRNAAFARDARPIDEACSCPVCSRFSRAYLRHLALAGEMLSAVLNSIHNLGFYLALLRNVRSALEQGRFPEYSSRMLSAFAEGAENP